MRINLLTVIGAIVLGAIVFFAVGCSADISGSIGTEMFYSDHNVFNGKPVTDPRKGKFSAGFLRNFGAGQEETHVGMGAMK